MTKCFLLTPTGATRRHETEHGYGDLTLYRRSDTGEVLTLNEAPPGAMWFATWLDLRWEKDGKIIYKSEGEGRTVYGFDWDNQFTPPLIVRTPDGDWDVDSRASNCTMKEDKLHRCWCRHGEAPFITVDKNGKTCNAEAGSIQSGSYHGFLQNGILT